MKQIKFRAWVKSAKTMCKVEMIDFENKRCHLLTNGTSWRNSFENSVFSQYTGLKDKHGNEIYEGDIVNITGKPYKSIEPIIVLWGNKSHGWKLKFNCGNHYEKRPLIKYYSLPASKDIEVVGNIYENPELLKS